MNESTYFERDNIDNYDVYFNGISYSLDYLSRTGCRRPSRGPTTSPIRLIHKNFNNTKVSHPPT